MRARNRNEMEPSSILCRLHQEGRPAIPLTRCCGNSDIKSFIKKLNCRQVRPFCIGARAFILNAFLCQGVWRMRLALIVLREIWRGCLISRMIHLEWMCRMP